MDDASANMKNTDNLRKAAFESVAKQEADEKKRVEAIISAHDG